MAIHTGATRRCELCRRELKAEGFKLVPQKVQPDSVRYVRWCAEWVRINAADLEEQQSRFCCHKYRMFV